MDRLYHKAVSHYPISKEFHKRDALATELIERLDKGFGDEVE